MNSLGLQAIAGACDQLFSEAQAAAKERNWTEVHIRWMQVYAFKRALSLEVARAKGAREKVDATVEKIDALYPDKGGVSCPDCGHVYNAGNDHYCPKCGEA